MAAHAKPLQARIKEHAVRAKNGCLIWRAAKYKSGYAKTKLISPFGSKLVYTRVSRAVLAEVLKRDLKPGEWALHTCDNPACVERSHLYLGTVTDNNRDTVRRGRWVDGRHNKTTKATRALLKRLYTSAAATQVALAERFGISQTRVSQIVRKA